MKSITYQIVKDTGEVVATKDSFTEAIRTAVNLSNVCSNLFTIRSVATETQDEMSFQLGKIK